MVFSGGIPAVFAEHIALGIPFQTIPQRRKMLEIMHRETRVVT